MVLQDSVDFGSLPTCSCVYGPKCCQGQELNSHWAFQHRCHFLLKAFLELWVWARCSSSMLPPHESLAYVPMPPPDTVRCCCCFFKKKIWLGRSQLQRLGSQFPDQGWKLGPPVLGVQSPNCWTTREVPLLKVTFCLVYDNIKSQC